MLFSRKKTNTQAQDLALTTPTTLLEAVYPQGKQRLEQVKVGSLPIGKAISPFLYDSQESRALRQKAQSGQPLSPQERQQAQQGFVMNFAGVTSPLASRQKIQSILPRLTPDDEQNMINLIDLSRIKKIGGKSVRPGSPEAVQAEINARYAAEGMGFSPDMSNGKLANLFDQILSRKRLFRRK